MTEQKTIMFVVEEGFTARSLLRSDFLDIIRNNFDRAVAVVPINKVDYYRQKFNYENILFEPMTEVKLGVTKKAFFKILKFSIPTRFNFIKLMRTVYSVHGGIKLSVWLLYFPFLYLAWLLGHIKFWRKMLRHAYVSLPVDENCVKLLNKHNPDLVYANYSDVGINNFNLELLKGAKKKGIKTVGNIFSWDNLYSKVFIPFYTDFATVPGQMVQDELIRLGDFPKDRIKIVGSPHFDFYRKKELIMDRDNFFAGLGADPNKKLVSFMLGNKIKEINLDNFLDLFSELINNELDGAVQLYVRPYPKREIDSAIIEKFSGVDNIIFEKRDADSLAGKGSIFEFADNDNVFLTNLIYHSSLIVSMYSTMPIEASIMDKPIILINYSNDDKKVNRWHSIEIHKEFEHINYLLGFGGLRVVNNNNEMISYFRKYINNEELDADGRLHLVKSQFGSSLGRSAELLSDFLININ